MSGELLQTGVVPSFLAVAARREDEWKSLRAGSTIYPECCRRERGRGVALPHAANEIVRRTNPPYRTTRSDLSGDAPLDK